MEQTKIRFHQDPSNHNSNNSNSNKREEVSQAVRRANKAEQLPRFKRRISSRLKRNMMNNSGVRKECLKMR